MYYLVYYYSNSTHDKVVVGIAQYLGVSTNVS